MLVYPGIGGRPSILAAVTNPHSEGSFLVPMLIDTGAEQTCFPAVYAAHFGHDNLHPDVATDECIGIGGKSKSYVHRLKINLRDPAKSTSRKSVVVWTSEKDTVAFVENLDCGFGLIGMDVIRQWKQLVFTMDKRGLMIGINPA